MEVNKKELITVERRYYKHGDGTVEELPCLVINGEQVPTISFVMQQDTLTRRMQDRTRGVAVLAIILSVMAIILEFVIAFLC